MENCLVTKLKGSVANDTLPMLNTIVVPIKKRTGSFSPVDLRFILQPISGDYINVRVENGWLVLNYNDYDDVSKHITSTIITTSQSFAVSNENCKVYLESKYSLSYITLPKELDTEDFDISNLSYLNKLTILDLGGHGKGDISQITNIPNVTNFSINTTSKVNNIVGTIESFVKSRIAEGRTTADKLHAIFSNMGYFGNITFGRNTTIPFGREHITWESGTKIAIYGNTEDISLCDRVHIVGYSDTEITINTASGGIWEGMNVIKCD